MTKISTISPGLAREYSASSTYEVGQYVLWRNAYWKCSVAISVTEEWTPDHWTLDESPLDNKSGLEDTYIRNPVTGKYHKLTAKLNELGEITIDVDQEGVDR